MVARKPKRFTRLQRWYRRIGGYTLAVSSLMWAVTGLGMYVSYWHIAYVATYAHEGYDSAHAEPVLIDALLMLSSLTRAMDKRKNLRPRRWATFTLVTTVLMTLAANGASAYIRGSGWWGVIVASVPAFALVAGSEVLTTKGRPKRRTTTRTKTAPATRDVTALTLVPQAA